MWAHNAASHSRRRACPRESVDRNDPAWQADDELYRRAVRVIAHCPARLSAMERHQPLGEFFDEKAKNNRSGVLIAMGGSRKDSRPLFSALTNPANGLKRKNTILNNDPNTKLKLKPVQ